jgi:hypothetical protein
MMFAFQLCALLTCISITPTHLRKCNSCLQHTGTLSRSTSENQKHSRTFPDPAILHENSTISRYS